MTRNMLAQNNVVGVGVHIAKHGQFTRIYGTQKFLCDHRRLA